MKNTGRNCFVSYHHESDQKFLAQLEPVITEFNASNRSLHTDLSHLEEELIYRRVRDLMRNCSITMVLVGEKTGHRKWIDWEIWASLRAYANPKNPERSFKPNGLVAIFLPGEKYSIPPRLQDNILSGYAVCVKWEHLQKDFHDTLELAYDIRSRAAHRIDNSRRRQKANAIDILGMRLKIM